MTYSDDEAFDAEVQPRAEVIALVRYTITPEDIAKTTAEYATLSADTTDGYESVRRAIAYCRHTRVEIEAQRKAKKAGALDFGRKVDSGAKALVALIEPIEAGLQTKKDVVDAERERTKREAAEAEKAALEAKIRAEREVEEARIKAERDAEEARLRAEREAEEQQLAEERRQLTAERKKLDEARIAEDERQRADKKAREELAAQEQARVDAERAELDRQRQELQAQQARAERDDFERQTQARLEREAKEQAERDRIADEEERIAAAERQAEHAKRLEALKPDVEKIRAFANAIGDLRAPSVQAEEAQEAVAIALAALTDVVNGLDLFANESSAASAAE